MLFMYNKLYKTRKTIRKFIIKILLNFKRIEFNAML